MSNWSDKILELSENAGYYSQARLAKAIKENASTLGTWLQGEEEPNVPYEALVNLADVLDVDVFDIMPRREKVDEACYQRVLNRVIDGQKRQPVDEAVKKEIEKARLVLSATLHELGQIKAEIDGE